MIDTMHPGPMSRRGHGVRRHRRRGRRTRSPLDETPTPAPIPERTDARDPQAVVALFERVYDELRSVSRGLMAKEAPGHTLQPTVLVHEVYLKLSRESDATWTDEAHLKAVAATVMRRLLIDHARSRMALKRGGGRKVQVEALDPEAESGLRDSDLLSLDEALTRLRDASERQARVVEMRYFGGMTFDQIATAIGVSPNTAKNDWRFARAWLQRAVEGGEREHEPR